MDSLSSGMGQSPELGLVPPMQFIPLLEETGLIFEVGAWALRQAAADHRRWIVTRPRSRTTCR